MSTVIDDIERAQLRRVPRFQAGDRLRVHFLVIEGTRRRTQVFEGVAIKRQGHGARETFTVRKQSFGVGVERTFPLHSPKIERIEVAARGDVRRAKLYYLRDRVGKAARVRERGYVGPEEIVEPGLVHAPAAPAADGEGTAEAQAQADGTVEAAGDVAVADAPAGEEGQAVEAAGTAAAADVTEAGADTVDGGADGPAQGGATAAADEAAADGAAEGAELDADGVAGGAGGAGEGDTVAASTVEGATADSATEPSDPAA